MRRAQALAAAAAVLSATLCPQLVAMLRDALSQLGGNNGSARYRLILQMCLLRAVSLVENIPSDLVAFVTIWPHWPSSAMSG